MRSLQAPAARSRSRLRDTCPDTSVRVHRERPGGYFALIFLIIPAQNPFFPSIFSAKYSPRTEACRDVPQVTRALRCVHVPTQECKHVPVKVAVAVLQQECHKVRIKIKEYMNIYIHLDLDISVDFRASELFVYLL